MSPEHVRQQLAYFMVLVQLGMGQDVVEFALVEPQPVIAPTPVDEQGMIRRRYQDLVHLLVTNRTGARLFLAVFGYLKGGQEDGGFSAVFN